MTELKPCPLCGGDAVYVYTPMVRAPWSDVGLDTMGITVVCGQCGCTIPSNMVQESVAEKWNRRTDG